MRKTLMMLLIVLFLVSVSSSMVAGHWLETVYDFEGETVTLVVWGGASAWWADFTSGRGLAHLQDIEERYNVNIEFERTGLHWAFPEQVFSYILEGNGNVIFDAQNQWLYMAAAQGYLLPLDDYLDDTYYSYMPDFMGGAMQRLNTFLGRTYGFSSFWAGLDQYSGYFQDVAGVYWNKDIFAMEGLPDLYELYEAGEWTWDRMEEIAIQATKDTTGDGEIDQWGLASRGHSLTSGDFLGYFYTWLATNGGDFLRTVDGRVEFNLTSEEAIETIEFWQRIHAAGAKGTRGQWIPGNLAMTIDIPWEINYPGWEEINFDFGYLPTPKGPRADEHVAVARIMTFGMLPINAENPEALLSLWHALGEFTSAQEPFVTRDFQTMEEWEDRLWADVTLGATDRETVETFRWMSANVRDLGMYQLLDAADGFPEALFRALTNEEGAATAMNAVAPSVQAFLDELLEQ